MTSEQKQRIEQIREAQMKRRESLAFHQSEYPGLPSPDYISDIDFLLSLVKSQWQPIETAPRTGIRSFDGHLYGPLILAYPVNGEVDTVEWWQSKQRPEACNFLDGGGNAAHPTHWMPLPDPPENPS